jgi:hypothetical protein
MIARVTVLSIVCQSLQIMVGWWVDSGMWFVAAG